MDRSAKESQAGLVRRRGPMAARLLAAAVCGALAVEGARHLSFASEAEAQRGPAGSGLLNPADQRNQMIAELRELNGKIDKLEKTLSKTLDVNVVSMPAQASSAGAGD